MSPVFKDRASSRNALGEKDVKAYAFSARVECTNGKNITVERPKCFNNDKRWTGSHDVVGFAP